MNTYTIGRRSGKTFCYSNPEVSNDHAEIVENNGNFTLIDHSTNGTLVNGNKVHNSSFPIKRGDMIMFAGREMLNWSMIPEAGTTEPEQSGTNVFAILGFVFAFLVSPLGLIFSIIGLSKAKKMGGKQKGLAIAGLIISIISLVVTLIYIIVIAGMVGAASAFDSYY
ncbi:MAG: FHA domain-containing protein [Bacteroidales bacterium]|nr:FHA domain-containing protein [Bacteroidales bacterium]